MVLKVKSRTNEYLSLYKSNEYIWTYAKKDGNNMETNSISDPNVPSDLLNVLGKMLQENTVYTFTARGIFIKLNIV